MKQKHEQNLTLQRSKSATASISTRNNNRRIIATNHHFRRSSEISDDVSDKLLVRRGSLSLVSSFSIQQQQQQHPKQTTRNKLSSLLCSFLNIFTFQTIIPTCKWLTIPSTALSVNSTTLGRKVTGTLFGHRRGNISFAVQLDPRSEPVLLLELAISTSSLVKEMSSGLVRIALECRKSTPAAPVTDGGKIVTYISKKVLRVQEKQKIQAFQLQIAMCSNEAKGNSSFKKGLNSAKLSRI